MFQIGGIEQLERHIDQQCDSQRHGDEEAKHEPADTDYGCQGNSGAGLQLSRCDRPKSLGGMLPVFLDIAHVIDQIDRGAHQAERDETQRSCLEHRWLEKAAGRQRRG